MIKIGKLTELWERFKTIGQNQEPKEEIPDDVTRDKYLRSLRRQRRVQMEELEKERLKRDITEFNKERARKYLWGIKETKKKHLNTLKQKQTRQSFLGRYKL